MVQVIAAHVEETGTASGRAVSVTAATANNRRFNAACSVGDTLDYTVKDGSGNWENGRATYSAANTITLPAAAEAGSNGKAPVTFSGTVTITLTQNTASIVRARGPRVASLGDSLTEGVFGIGSSLAHMFPFYSSGVWQFVANGGISGQPSSSIVPRIWPDCLSHKPDLVNLLMGTNDTQSEYQVAIPAAGAAVRGTGAIAAVYTTPPISTANGYNGGPSAVQARNSWIRSWFATITDPGIVLVDIDSILDAGDGTWAVATDTLDGLHWSPSGMRKAAKYANAVLAPYAPIAPFFPRPRYIGNGTAAIVNNGFFNLGSASGGVAAGWSLGISGATPSIVAPTTAEALGGNWQQIVVPAGGSGYFGSAQTAAALTPFKGRRVRMSFRIVSTNVEESTGTATSNFSNVYLTAVSDFVTIGSTPALNVNADNQVFAYEFIVPAYAVDLNVSFQIYNNAPNGGPTITLKIGEVSIVPVDTEIPIDSLPTSFAKVQYSSNYAVVESGQDQCILLNVNSGNNCTVTLPSMNGISGRLLTFTRGDNDTSHNATFTGSNGQPINGAGSITGQLVNQWSTISLQAIDYGWSVVAKVGT